MSLAALYGREFALRRVSLPLAYALFSRVLLEAAPMLRTRRLEAFVPSDLWVRARSDRWYADLAVVDAWATALTFSVAVFQGLALALPALHRLERRRLLVRALPLARRPWRTLALLLHVAVPASLEVLAASVESAEGSESSARSFAPPLRSSRERVLALWLRRAIAGCMLLVPRVDDALLRAARRVVLFVLALSLADGTDGRDSRLLGLAVAALFLLAFEVSQLLSRLSGAVVPGAPDASQGPQGLHAP